MRMQVVDANDLNSGRCIAVYYIGMEKKKLQWGYGNCLWRKHGQLAPNKIKFHMEGDQRYPQAPNKIKKFAWSNNFFL